MSVSIQNSFSAPIPMHFGYTQGSVIGLYYILCTNHTFGLFCPLKIIDFHIYADDTHLYVPYENGNGNNNLVEKGHKRHNVLHDKLQAKIK